MDKQPEPAQKTGARDEDDDFMPSISLERYMSGRRRQRASWVHLTTIIFMLAALTAVFLFKDQCGQSVSRTIFMYSADKESPAPSIAPSAPGRSTVPAPPSSAPAREK